MSYHEDELEDLLEATAGRGNDVDYPDENNFNNEGEKIMSVEIKDIKKILVVGKNIDEFQGFRDGRGIDSEVKAGGSFVSGGVYFKYASSGAELKGANSNEVAVLFVGDKAWGKEKYDREGSVCPITTVDELVGIGVLKEAE